MNGRYIFWLVFFLNVVAATAVAGPWQDVTISSYRIDTGVQPENPDPSTIYLALPAGFTFEVESIPSFAIAHKEGTLYIVGKGRAGQDNTTSFLVVALNDTPPYKLQSVSQKRAEGTFNASYAIPVCTNQRAERKVSWRYVYPLVGSPKGEAAFYIDRVECGDERSIYEGSIRRQAMRCSIPEIRCSQVGLPSTYSQVTGFGRYDMSYHSWGIDLVPFTADDSGHREYRSFPGTHWIKDGDGYPATSVKLMDKKAYKNIRVRDNQSTVSVGGIFLDTLPGPPRPTSMVAENIWHHAHVDSYFLALDHHGKAFKPNIDRLVEYHTPLAKVQISASVSNGTWPAPTNSTCGAPFILPNGHGQFFVGRVLNDTGDTYRSSAVNLIDWVNDGDYRQGLRLVAAGASIGLGQAFVDNLEILFTVEIYRNASGQINPMTLELNVVGRSNDNSLLPQPNPLRCHCPEPWYWYLPFWCRPSICSQSLGVDDYR